jgi:hypothetical protein
MIDTNRKLKGAAVDKHNECEAVVLIAVKLIGLL